MRKLVQYIVALLIPSSVLKLFDLNMKKQGDLVL